MNPENLIKKYMKVAYHLYSLFEMRNGIGGRNKDNIKYEIHRRKQHLEEYKDVLKKLDTEIKVLKTELTRIANSASRQGICIPFEDMAKKNNLGLEERYIILIMYFRELEKGRFQITGRQLLLCLGYQPFQFIEKSESLENLMEKGLIEGLFPDPYMKHFLEAEFALSAHTFKSITRKEITEENDEEIELPFEVAKHPPRESRDTKKRRSRLLNVYEPALTFELLVLESEKIREIERAIFQAKNLKKIFDEWGFNQTIKYGKGTILLFYGLPGTGKTAVSEAIAHRLGKKIGVVNYENILGCWVGESEKNLVSVFEDARKEDCVLVFDEADALFAKRFYETYSTDRMHNYMTNILMKEIERFEGIIILTTNREIVMDEAFDRRITLKLKFDVPRPEERARIWRKLIPEKTPLAPDVDFEKLGRRYELTGGEIKNAILNAVMECGYQGEDRLKMEHLEQAADRETQKLKGRGIKSFGFNAGNIKDCS